jgi:uncharacterized protein YdhG (YjbR/CyaY superfamily)
MYKYNDNIVSGSHSIYYENRWGKVCDCPLFLRMDTTYDLKEEFIYCLNTEQKVIPVKNNSFTLLFCDWDEFIDAEMIEKIVSIKVAENKMIQCKENINECVDTGFQYNFRVLLKNGKRKKMVNLKIGDVLECGEIVIGIVTIIKNDNSLFYHLLTNTSTFRINDKNNHSVLYNDYNDCVDKYMENNSCL